MAGGSGPLEPLSNCARASCDAGVVTLSLTKAFLFDDLLPPVTFVRLDVWHDRTTHDGAHQLCQMIAPDVCYLSIKQSLRDCSQGCA